MKYDELVNRLRCKARLVREYNDTGMLEDKAADAIEELLGVTQMYQNQAWIPTSEKLPEENSEVLIFTERRDVIYGTFADGMFSDDWQYYTPDYVVCWMYIPEPPKEEN